MYDNEIYNGEGTGTNTSGADSRQNQEMNQNTQYNQEERGSQNNQNVYQGSSASAWNGTNSYRSCQSGSDNGAANGAYGSNTGSGNYGNSSAGSGNYGNGSAGNGNYGNGNYENSSYGNSNYGSGSYESSGYGNGSYGNNYGSNGNRGKKEKKSSGFFRKAAVSVSMGVFFGLFAGIGFYGVQLVTGSIPAGSGSQTVISENVNNGTDGGQNAEGQVSDAAEESKSGIKITDTTQVRVVSSDVTDVVEEVMPAMVSIINNYTEKGTTIFGQSYTQELAASGSGIIVAESDTELLVVTNYHVIEGTTTLEVTFIDESTAEAQVKGTDSDMDLAVIAIPLDSLSEETKNSIAIATLGDSDSLKMGEPVIAIGNALGYGQSVTNGIVSAVNREITLEDGSTGTFIQTNAAINPGNSGGALLNVNGEVIGINSNKIGGTTIEGMGYAIPISAAKPIISELMLKETRTKVESDQIGYIGITMQTIDSQFNKMYNIPMGVYIVSVADNSPAKEAGLLSGDVITEFEGEKISEYEDLQDILQYYGAGSTVTITVMRPQNGEYQSKQITLTLGSKPATNN